ncbi:hypothetical protein [Mycetohabitans endofungorum]|nr:hypothetical protein [Mycetohabitans endofungorum]
MLDTSSNSPDEFSSLEDWALSTPLWMPYRPTVAPSVAAPDPGWAS